VVAERAWGAPAGAERRPARRFISSPPDPPLLEALAAMAAWPPEHFSGRRVGRLARRGAHARGHAGSRRPKTARPDTWFILGRQARGPG
jgi:hypothetical protein